MSLPQICWKRNAKSEAASETENGWNDTNSPSEPKQMPNIYAYCNTHIYMPHAHTHIVLTTANTHAPAHMALRPEACSKSAQKATTSLRAHLARTHLPLSLLRSLSSSSAYHSFALPASPCTSSLGSSIHSTKLCDVIELPRNASLMATWMAA